MVVGQNGAISVKHFGCDLIWTQGKAVVVEAVTAVVDVAMIAGCCCSGGVDLLPCSRCV